MAPGQTFIRSSRGYLNYDKGALGSKHQGIRMPKFTKPAVAQATLKEHPLPRPSPEEEAKLKQMQQILKEINK